MTTEREDKKRHHGLVLASLCTCIVASVSMSASADAAAEMQKKLQNPLGNIKAIMTDNVVGFDTVPIRTMARIATATTASRRAAVTLLVHRIAW